MNYTTHEKGWIIKQLGILTEKCQHEQR